MTSTLRAAVAAAVALFGSAMSGTATVSAQTEHHTLAGERVAIYDLAGRVRVQGGSGSQVTVDVTRGGRDAARLRIATGDVRGTNSLRVIFPADRIVYPQLGYRSRTDLRVNADGTFGDGDRGASRDRDRVEIRGSGDGLEAFADLVVGVPKGQQIVVHLAVGEATVSNVDGDIRVSVAAARLTSEHTRGRLDLDTGSGTVSVTDAQGDVRLDTGSGGVTLDGVHGETLIVDTGSGSVRGTGVDVRTLRVDVGSGGIHLSGIKASSVNLDSGSGTVELWFLSTVNDLSADSGSGGVTVRLPASQGGDVDIETSSGGIQSDFAVTTSRMSRRHLRGHIGEGNARIHIQSGSGSVRLLKS